MNVDFTKFLLHNFLLYLVSILFHFQETGKMAEEIDLSTLFDAKNEIDCLERVKVAVKILKKTSETIYKIADVGFHCSLKFENVFETEKCRKKLCQKGICVWISNAKVNKYERTIVFDKESSLEECEPLDGIELEACCDCNEILNGEFELAKHFRKSKSCKKRYDNGSGWVTTVFRFLERKYDNYDALQLKILTKVSDHFYEAADDTGVCRLKIDSEHPQKILIKVGKSFEFVNPKRVKGDDKIVYVGKLCKIKSTANLKIPIAVYNQDITKTQTVTEASKTEEKVVCEGCRNEFEFTSLLRHIARNDDCKEEYGDRFETMKKERKFISKQKCLKKSQEKKWQQTASVLSEDPAKMEESFKTGYILKCEGCDTNFTTHEFFKHVSHKKTCKSVYGERFNELKKAKRRIVSRMSGKRQKRKEKAKAYEVENAEIIAKRKKKKYQEKRQKDLLEKKEEDRKEKHRRAIEMHHLRAKHHLNEWKKCRLSDHKKFSDFNQDDDFNEKIADMKIKIDEVVKKYSKRIEQIYNESKEMDEDEGNAKLACNQMKELVESMEHGDFAQEIEEFDKAFEEIANSQNDILTCFDCERMRLICSKCRKPILAPPKVNGKKTKKSKKNGIMQRCVKKAKKRLSKGSGSDDSPKITKKPLIVKRRRIAFTWEDYENDVEDENDEDY